MNKLCIDTQLSPEELLTRQVVINRLLDDQSYHIEFNGHLTNHNKHAVIALAGLGASAETIDAYYKNYAQMTPYGYGLEKPKISQYEINEANWQNYLGQRTSYSSYFNFFDAQEKKLGMEQMLSQYLVTLLPGWAGSLMHPAIHLGWAIDVNNRAMIIESMAYMAFSYVSCHPERTEQSTQVLQDKTVFDSLIRIAHFWENDSDALHDWVEGLIIDEREVGRKIHLELKRSGLQYRIARMFLEGHPIIDAKPAWLDDQNISTLWLELYYVTTLLYMVQPGDFLVLHFITSLYAMEHIARKMPKNEQKKIVQYYWTGILNILFSRAEFPGSLKLATLNEQFRGANDGQEAFAEMPNWDEIIPRAIDEIEEHNPKMVYVLHQIWKRSGYQSLFRVAASHFTQTPELPKSFEAPPVI